MQYCHLCGLDKYQLCYHTKICYLRETDQAGLSSSIVQRLSELVAIEMKYYSEVLPTIPDEDLLDLQRPTLICLSSIYDNHIGNQGPRRC